eukprot:m.24008 g.24008  ORF g.24008 m.24008 type:complete len:745 (-) comp8601_c0_seq1:91-2325(-)
MKILPTRIASLWGDWRARLGLGLVALVICLDACGELYRFIVYAAALLLTVSALLLQSNQQWARGLNPRSALARRSDKRKVVHDEREQQRLQGQTPPSLLARGWPALDYSLSFGTKIGVNRVEQQTPASSVEVVFVEPKSEEEDLFAARPLHTALRRALEGHRIRILVCGYHSSGSVEHAVWGRGLLAASDEETASETGVGLLAHIARLLLVDGPISVTASVLSSDPFDLSSLPTLSTNTASASAAAPRISDESSCSSVYNTPVASGRASPDHCHAPLAQPSDIVNTVGEACAMLHHAVASQRPCDEDQPLLVTVRFLLPNHADRCGIIQLVGMAVRSPHYAEASFYDAHATIVSPTSSTISDTWHHNLVLLHTPTASPTAAARLAALGRSPVDETLQSASDGCTGNMDDLENDPEPSILVVCREPVVRNTLFSRAASSTTPLRVAGRSARSSIWSLPSVMTSDIALVSPSPDPTPLPDQHPPLHTRALCRPAPTLTSLSDPSSTSLSSSTVGGGVGPMHALAVCHPLRTFSRLNSFTDSSDTEDSSQLSIDGHDAARISSFSPLLSVSEHYDEALLASPLPAHLHLHGTHSLTPLLAHAREAASPRTVSHLAVIDDSPVMLPPAALAPILDPAFASLSVSVCDDEYSPLHAQLAAREAAWHRAQEELERLRPLVHELATVRGPGGALERLRQAEEEVRRLQSVALHAAQLGAMQGELERVRAKYGELLTLVLEVAPQALERRKY